MTIAMRNMQANYLNVGTAAQPNYALMGVGFTKLDEKPNAKNKSKKYINDVSETKTITGYDWSAPYESDQIKDQEPIKFIYEIGKYQKVGSDAETDYIIVDLDEPAEGKGTVFNARKINVAIEVNEFGSDDGQMTCKGNLLGKGNMIQGTFDTSTRTFTPKAAGVTPASSKQ